MYCTYVVIKCLYDTIENNKLILIDGDFFHNIPIYKYTWIHSKNSKFKTVEDI